MGMLPLVVLGSQGRWCPFLQQAVKEQHIPLFVYAAQGSAAAFGSLKALNFAAAILEDLGLQALALGELEHLEPEAHQAARVDLIIPENTGNRGYYVEPLALANLLRRYSFGDKAIWIGPARPELIQGLRALSKVSVLSRNFSEGESFLGRLPTPQRGVVGVADVQSEAIAHRADLVIYAGGNLPLSLLQPYHTLLALKPPPPDALRLVSEYIPPEALQHFHLSALLEALGYKVAPEVFQS
jgi:hypothetical protein